MCSVMKNATGYQHGQLLILTLQKLDVHIGRVVSALLRIRFGHQPALFDAQDY